MPILRDITKQSNADRVLSEVSPHATYTGKASKKANTTLSNGTT